MDIDLVIAYVISYRSVLLIQWRQITTGQFLTPEALLSGHSELPKQTFNKNYATHFKIYEMD